MWYWYFMLLVSSVTGTLLEVWSFKFEMPLLALGGVICFMGVGFFIGGIVLCDLTGPEEGRAKDESGLASAEITNSPSSSSGVAVGMSNAITHSHSAIASMATRSGTVPQSRVHSVLGTPQS